ncbi:hypothetical protein ERJ75_000474900 [Trypanosoma vivax]|nr:hypothetical protein ERJ75_000474900 [Trypanosoma vivax]
MCRSIASWWFGNALSVRRRLETVKAQAAHIVAGIPKAANREDALREARLKPINEVTRRRALEYNMRIKVKGPTHAKVADSPSVSPDRHTEVTIMERGHNKGHSDAIATATEGWHDAGFHLQARPSRIGRSWDDVCFSVRLLDQHTRDQQTVTGEENDRDVSPSHPPGI